MRILGVGRDLSNVPDARGAGLAACPDGSAFNDASAYDGCVGCDVDSVGGFLTDIRPGANGGVGRVEQSPAATLPNASPGPVFNLQSGHLAEVLEIAGKKRGVA
jgi:hypothetical protein